MIIIEMQGSLQKISSQFDSIILKGVKPLLDNQYFFGVIHLFLILYATTIAPNLPPILLNLLDNFFVKLLCMFSILILAKISPMTSLLVALAFLVTMNYVTKGKFIELMRNVKIQQYQEALENIESEIPTIESEIPNEVDFEVPEVDFDVLASKPITEDADAQIPLASGCLPDRKIDMSQVSGISSANSFSAVNF